MPDAPLGALAPQAALVDRWSAYGGPEARAETGWSFDVVVAPAVLGGANGIVEHQGRLMVTQVFGSQVTAIDTTTGVHRAFAPLGAGISAPDDGVFGHDGTFFATEPMHGTVSARNPDGTYRKLRDDLPGINGITMDRSRRRLFADEFRPGGTLWELDPAGEKPPIKLLGDLFTPNALAVGPDEALWFPLVMAGEIWRYDFNDRSARCVFAGLAAPCAVKFDSAGRLLTPQAGTGEVTRIDLATGAREVIAQAARGIDNIAISPEDRLFVSHFTDGRVAEWSAAGERVLSPSGLVGPYGLGVYDDGSLLVADGLSVAHVGIDGAVVRTHTLINDLPTLAIDAAVVGGDAWVLGLRGQVFRFRPGAAAEPIAGRLNDPTGLSAHAAGGAWVVERGAGRVGRIPAEGGAVVALIANLDRPHGVAMSATGEDSASVWVTTADGLLEVSPAGEVRRRVAELARGQGVAVGADGRVAVALAAKGEVAVFDPSTNRITTAVRCAALASPVPEASLPHASAAVVADGPGWLVGCGGDGSIRRLRPS